MATVTFKDSTINLEGTFPRVGDSAPDFKVIKQDLSEVGLGDLSGKIKVLIAVPSLDTPVCAKETREFNVKLGGISDAVGLVISTDLPFAQKRFCGAEGIENVMTGSQFRDFNFSKAYGTHIPTGPLTGLSARAVFVVDKSNKISYIELVPDIGAEPDYNKVLEEVKKLA